MSDVEKKVGLFAAFLGAVIDLGRRLIGRSSSAPPKRVADVMQRGASGRAVEELERRQGAKQ